MRAEILSLDSEVVPVLIELLEDDPANEEDAPGEGWFVVDLERAHGLVLVTKFAIGSLGLKTPHLPQLWGLRLGIDDLPEPVYWLTGEQPKACRARDERTEFQSST